MDDTLNSPLQDSPRFLNKRIVVFASVAGGILLLVIVAMILSFKKESLTRQNNVVTPGGSTTTQNQNDFNPLPGGDSSQFDQTTIRKLPSVNFTSYNLQTSLPASPTSLSGFEFKTSYSNDDIASLGKKLGISTAKTKTVKDFIVVNETSGNSQKYLRVNTSTGNFIFADSAGTAFSIQNKNYLALARNYVDKTGIFGGDIAFTNYYKDSDSPGLIFVEGHRDWAAVGNPILNLTGLLNLPEERSLSQIRLGQVFSTDPANPTISFSLDGMAGKTRPLSFNSVVVMIGENDNKIHSMASNMRIINTKSSYVANQLKTPQEAFEALQSGQDVQTMTLPTAVGILDPSKVYPDGKAIGKVATVTDVILAYLEKSADEVQSSMSPYYIFRGVSTLDSGYTVKFVQTVPALKSPISAENVLGITTVQAAEIPTPTPLLTPLPDGVKYNIISGTPPTPGAPGIPWNGSCPVFTNQYRVAGGYIAWFDPKVDGSVRYWFFVPDDPTKHYTDQELDDMRPSGYKLLWSLNALQQKVYCDDQAHKDEAVCEKTGVGEALDACPRDMGTTTCLADNNTTKQGIACYYIVAVSPSIYIYGNDGQKFSIAPRPSSKLTLLDPLFNDTWGGKWNGQLQKGQLKLSNGNKVNRLYYEYEKNDKVTNLIRSSLGQDGYLVRLDNLDSFLKTNLFDALKLNKQEREDLSAEVKRETAGLNAQFIRLSLIPRPVLDTVLPLDINPYPDNLSRVHLYIAPANMFTLLNKPQITAVSHTGYAVVETGVFVDRQ